MKITLIQPNRAQKPVYFLGRKQRLATMTAVRFIQPDLIVVAHLVGQTLILLSLDHENNRYHVVDKLDNTAGGRPTIVDLLDYDGQNTLLSSNFDAGNGTLYRLHNNRLNFYRELSVPPGAGECHGARFITPDIACLSTNKHFLFVFNIHTNKILCQLKTPFHVKDLHPIDDKHWVLAFALNGPTPGAEPTYASGLMYIAVDIEQGSYKILDKWFFRPAAFDAITHDPATNIFYTTDQYGDRVIAVTIRQGKFIVLGEYDGFNFPHGIHAFNNQLAVTNYGDSSISIQPIAQMKRARVRGISQRYRPYSRQEVTALCRYYSQRLMAKVMLKT